MNEGLEEKMREKVGKCVIVTGGTRGIGRAISERLLKEGYSVYAGYRDNDDAAGTFKSEIAGKVLTGHLRTVRADVSDKGLVDSLFEGLEGREIIGIVNNAGIYPRDDSVKELKRTFDTNVLGPYFMIRSFGEYRRNQELDGIGAVVNISSTSALHGYTGNAIYAASKAALDRLSKVLAVEYAERGLLHINSVVCGPVETEMLNRAPCRTGEYVKQTPTRRLTTPQEAANAVSWLVENRNQNIVGAAITLDGGRIL